MQYNTFDLQYTKTLAKVRLLFAGLNRCNDSQILRILARKLTVSRPRPYYTTSVLFHVRTIPGIINGDITFDTWDINAV